MAERAFRSLPRFDRRTELISGYPADEGSLNSGARGKHDELFDHFRKDRDCWVFLTGLVVVDDRSDVESELEGDLGDGREAGDSSV